MPDARSLALDLKWLKLRDEIWIIIGVLSITLGKLLLLLLEMLLLVLMLLLCFYSDRIINNLSNVLVTVSVCRHFPKSFGLKEWARSNVTRKAALIFTWFVLPINFIPNSNWLHAQNKSSCKAYFLSWQN